MRSPLSKAWGTEQIWVKREVMCDAARGARGHGYPCPLETTIPSRSSKLDMELNGFCVMSDEDLISSVVLFPHSLILEWESLFCVILYVTFLIL